MSFFAKTLPCAAILLSFLWPLVSLSLGEIEIILEIDELDETLEIESVEWGMKNPSTYMNPEPPEFDDVGFASLLSESSPELFLRTASGNHFTQAKLSFYEKGQANPFYEITLDTVTISSAGIETTEEEVRQEISLYYLKIRWTYYTFDSEGEVDEVFEEGWDRASQSQW
ncbi:MAG: type VI secretion system tube protein Hcp [Opitutales bacterium]|nr:type VI secretion system tube protein Hcp [Opitutales bacterium]